MKKLKILFDTDILVLVWLKRDIGTGIYYATYNILMEMLARDDVDVFAYSGTNQLGRMRYAIEKVNLMSLKIFY